MRLEPAPTAGPAGHGLAADDLARLRTALTALGLSGPRPVLVLVGGASSIDPAVADALLGLFRQLAPLLDDLGITLVDGGTAFGVMAAIGQARHDQGARFPLLGVAASGTVSLADPPPRWTRVQSDVGASDTTAAAGARLDPHHSHLLLVPGDQWGDESPWIAAAATCLAAGRPSLTLVAAGGQITRLDVREGLDAGRPLLVLTGTGGTADQIADWYRHRIDVPDLALTEAQRPLIEIMDLAVAADRLPTRLAQILAT